MANVFLIIDRPRDWQKSKRGLTTDPICTSGTIGLSRSRPSLSFLCGRISMPDRVRGFWAVGERNRRGVGRFIYVGDCEPGKVRASFALIPDPTGGVASAPVVLIRRYVAIDVKNRSLNKFSANLYLKSMRRKSSFDENCMYFRLR